MAERFWTVGDVVRKLRKAKHLSQARLAKLADVDKSALVRLESDSDRSEQRTIDNVVNALKANRARVYAHAEARTLSSQEIEVVDTLEELSASRRERVVHLLRETVSRQREEEANRVQDHESAESPPETDRANPSRAQRTRSR